MTDSSGAVISGASINIDNPVSHYSNQTTSDKNGKYQFTNLPFNPYHLAIIAQGFASSTQDVEVRSVVPAIHAYTAYGPKPMGGLDYPHNFGLSFQVLTKGSE